MIPQVLTGIDLVETGRIRDLLARHDESFRSRVFTAQEQEYCQASARPAERYAARFAAKEAVAKALGTGIGEGAAWSEIEVVKQPGGRPAIVLHGSAAATAASLGVADIQLSLTHTAQYAAAVAVLICGGRPLRPESDCGRRAE